MVNEFTPCSSSDAHGHAKRQKCCLILMTHNLKALIKLIMNPLSQNSLSQVAMKHQISL